MRACCICFLASWLWLSWSRASVSSTRDLMSFRAPGRSEYHGVLQRVQCAHARHQGAALSWPPLCTVHHCPFLRCRAVPSCLARRMFRCRCWSLRTRTRASSLCVHSSAAWRPLHSLNEPPSPAGREKPARHVLHQEGCRRVASIAAVSLAHATSLTVMWVQASCQAARNQGMRLVAPSR